MTENRKPKRAQENPAVVVTNKPPDRPPDEEITAITIKSPSGIEGILWPPFVTNSFTAELALQVQFEISQWWRADRVLSHQLAQLHTVMVHAAKTTPFYRDRLEAVLAQSEKGLSLSTGPLLNELPIKHFQLVQKTTKLIEARLVVGRPLTSPEELALADYFNKGWQHEFSFQFVYVDAITRGANGKYEVFRCEVPTQ